MKTLAYDVKGLGNIIEVCDNFHSELQALKAAKASPITPRNEALARIKTTGKEDIGRTQGTWTTAGLEYAKGQAPLLKLRSRLLSPKLAKQAVEANRDNQYFSIKSTQEYKKSLEQAEKDKSKEPSKRNVIVLPSRKVFKITQSENWEVLESLLKDQAKEYFEFNGNHPISFYPVDKDTVDAQDGTLLTQLWFLSVDDWSELCGYYWYLHYDDFRLRGVQKSGEAAQKISAPKVEIYTQKQLSEVLRQEGITGKLEKSILEALKRL